MSCISLLVLVIITGTLNRVYLTQTSPQSFLSSASLPLKAATSKKQSPQPHLLTQSTPAGKLRGSPLQKSVFQITTLPQKEITSLVRPTNAHSTEKNPPNGKVGVPIGTLPPVASQVEVSSPTPLSTDVTPARQSVKIPNQHSSISSSSGGSSTSQVTFPPSEPELYFYWDKQRVSPKDYAHSFCAKRCNGVQMTNSYNGILSCPDYLCFNCDCVKPTCEIYGTCCPDVSEPRIGIELRQLATFAGPTDSTTLTIRESTTKTGKQSVSSGEPKDGGGASLSGSNMSGPNDFDESERKHSKLVCDYTSLRGLKFLNVRSCPSDFVDLNISRLCQENLPMNEITEASYVRVSDTNTNVVYYNRYCAECNGANETVTWPLEIDCFHNMYVYAATNKDELLRLSLDTGSDCKVSQSLPKDMSFTYCYARYFQQDRIEKCNVTGQWKTYDEGIRQACEGKEFSAPTYIMSRAKSYGSYVFKNIFCGICNNGTYPGTASCLLRPHDIKVGWTSGPFSLLLGFRESALDHKTKPKYKSPFTYSVNCSEMEWPSPDGECLPLLCSPGKVLDGTACSTAINSITGLAYRIWLWFIPIDYGVLPKISVNASVLEKEKKNILDAFKQQIKYLLDLERMVDDYSLEFGLIISTPMEHLSPTIPHSLGTDSTSLTLEFFEIRGGFIAKPSIARDAFENNMTSALLNSTVTVEILEGTELELEPSVTVTSTESINIYKRARPETFVFYSESDSQTAPNPIYSASGSFLKITQLLTCSFISVNNTSYTFTKSSSPPYVSIILAFQATTVTFSDAADFNQLNIDNDDGSLKICHELLDRKLLEVDDLNRQAFYDSSAFKSQADTSTIAQNILTWICTGASMICLALTLLTYFLFSVLRSIAGKNNIFLCASLLLAQALLLTANYENGPSPLCTALGIAVHFLWLCTFCWSFICCFHMYGVFTAKTRNKNSTARSQMLQLLKNVTLSVLVPVLIIVTVTVTSSLTSDKSRIGYGNRACYLDSNVLVVVSTIAPLALVTLFNIIFFTVTVIKIHNVRKLQTHDLFNKEDHQNLYVYIKLSTMTGAFWTVFVIAEALDFDPLRFVAIILNGLQGVFIFMSYICNKRVLNLYRRGLSLKSLDTTPSGENKSSVGRSTLGRVASEIHREPNKKGNRDGRLPTSSENMDGPPSGIINGLDLNVDDKDSETTVNNDVSLPSDSKK